MYAPVPVADAEKPDPSPHLERTVSGAVLRGAPILRQLSLRFFGGAVAVSTIGREAADAAVGGPPEGVHGNCRPFHIRGGVVGSVCSVRRSVDDGHEKKGTNIRT